FGGSATKVEDAAKEILHFIDKFHEVDPEQLCNWFDSASATGKRQGISIIWDPSEYPFEQIWQGNIFIGGDVDRGDINKVNMQLQEECNKKRRINSKSLTQLLH